jgi:hypothetical protein
MLNIIIDISTIKRVKFDLCTKLSYKFDLYYLGIKYIPRTWHYFIVTLTNIFALAKGMPITPRHPPTSITYWIQS